MDQSARFGIVPSTNLFTAIENDAVSRAIPEMIIQLGTVTGTKIDEIAMEEARKMLLNRGSSESLRDAVWSVLIRESVIRPRFWQPIAIWTMVPFLRLITRRLHGTWHVDLQDLRSEVVVSFLEALRQADPCQAHLGQRLWWNTYRIARKMCRQKVSERPSLIIESLAAVADDCVAPPSRSADAGVVFDGERDAQTIESVRLGSLAARLGLRAVVAAHRPSGGMENVIFLPPSRRSRKPGVVNVRGNGSGEVA